MYSNRIKGEKHGHWIQRGLDRGNDLKQQVKLKRSQSRKEYVHRHKIILDKGQKTWLHHHHHLPWGLWFAEMRVTEEGTLDWETTGTGIPSQERLSTHGPLPETEFYPKWWLNLHTTQPHTSVHQNSHREKKMNNLKYSYRYLKKKVLLKHQSCDCINPVEQWRWESLLSELISTQPLRSHHWDEDWKCGNRVQSIRLEEDL